MLIVIVWMHVIMLFLLDNRIWNFYLKPLQLIKFDGYFTRVVTLTT